MPSKNIPQEHRDAMVGDCRAGATAEEAAAQFGYSYMACLFAVKQRGIKPGGRSEAHRRYAVDETFFDVVNAEAKAYWLGFLTADGKIGDDHIKLELQEQDVAHLYKFTASLRSNHPVVLRERTLHGKAHPYPVVWIGSTRLVTALNRLGVVGRRSFTVRPSYDV